MGEPLKQKIGDAEAALAAAPHKVDVTYRTPRHNHTPIELHAARSPGRATTLRIHDASQVVAHERGRSPRCSGSRTSRSA